MRSLTRWNPLRDLVSLHKDMDDLFKRSLGDFGGLMTEEAVYPAIECYMRDNTFTVKALVPGIDPKEVHVSVLGNRLTLKGETKKDKSIKEEDYVLREVRYGSFERTITIPEGVEIDKFHASFENGTLMITAPAKEAAKPKKIDVEVSEKKAGAV